MLNWAAGYYSLKTIIMYTVLYSLAPKIAAGLSGSFVCTCRILPFWFRTGVSNWWPVGCIWPMGHYAVVLGSRPTATPFITPAAAADGVSRLLFLPLVATSCLSPRVRGSAAAQGTESESGAVPREAGVAETVLCSIGRGWGGSDAHVGTHGHSAVMVLGECLQGMPGMALTACSLCWCGSWGMWPPES